MTIKLPEPNILDRLLKVMGKKRGVYIPTDSHTKFGPYGYSRATKENIIKALLRPNDEELADGCVDVFDLIDIHISETKETDE